MDKQTEEILVELDNAIKKDILEIFDETHELFEPFYIVHKTLSEALNPYENYPDWEKCLVELKKVVKHQEQA